MTTVLIAVDETEASVQAAEVAYRLFGDSAEYMAINVVEGPLPPTAAGDWDTWWGVAYPVPWAMVWPYSHRAAGDPAAGPAVAPDFTAESTAAGQAERVADRSGLEDAAVIGEVGDPAEAILEAAQAHQVDVIVVGSHDRGWLSRLFTPSVASDVIKRADVPVLIAK